MYTPTIRFKLSKNSIYCIPNIALALLGGEFVDIMGVNISALIFALLLIVGSVLVAISSGFWGMLWGRLVFGIGGECMMVCQSKILTEVLALI